MHKDYPLGIEVISTFFFSVVEIKHQNAFNQTLNGRMIQFALLHASATVKKQIGLLPSNSLNMILCGGDGTML